ncbi:hypothetical protein AVEN_41540-1 [Araneus ventricosus]|uniref:Uncharacterized protein n=1 Tax=Araneus ventricosus TaxID=182803 RepID=A0A4Y2RFP3_ARAVE|nr:hypothetical protein AVEN_41540-1 [Araneus ventricosus]
MEFLEHRKEKTIVKVENLWNLEQMIRNGGIQKNLNSETQSADSNLIPRLEGSGISKDLSTLGLRVEGRNETRNLPWGGEEGGQVEFCDFEPCLKTNFGTSVNALPYFSNKMGEENTGLMTNGIASLLLNAQLPIRKPSARLRVRKAESILPK